MSFLKDLFIEGEGKPSIGSVCFCVFVLGFTGCMIYAQVAGKAMPVTAEGCALIAVAIYGCKKAAGIVEAAKKAVGSANQSQS